MRVGILWRAEWDPVSLDARIAESCRLHGMFSAFADLGGRAEPVVYSDEAVDSVRTQLLGLDGALVWVNPIERGLDRSRLDPLLREVAGAGTWVSAHPDVILRMATKEVLVDTAEMSWSAAPHLYRSHEQLRAELPLRLVSERPVVLKQHRGMGGDGVWKVELAEDGRGEVLVQHAAGDSGTQRLPLDLFLDRCADYFAGNGLMVEQSFQSRLPEGMIRAYLCHDQVVGFAHQFPRGLLPAGSTPPTGKRFEPAATPRFQALRSRLETEWVPQLQSILEIPTSSLPVIWDADFLYGPRTAAGEDTYVLCEINASSTFAFPEFAMPAVAAAALERIRRR
ncbi:MAG TPA: Cj0069 family protein [Gaiellaceae bacterium]|nr:Cj0069 family protein [Gaiellaceae bacterium]